MLNDIEKLAEKYVPGAADYRHSKIWYRIYNSSDDSKHPGDLEHVHSFKTLREIYAYALEDRDVLIGCLYSIDELIETIDQEDRHTIIYNSGYAGRREFTIKKLRPKDIRLGWLIRFELFTRDFGFIRKIHIDYKDTDYKDYDAKQNGGDKFCGEEENDEQEELKSYKSEINSQYYMAAERFILRQ